MKDVNTVLFEVQVRAVLMKSARNARDLCYSWHGWQEMIKDTDYARAMPEVLDHIGYLIFVGKFP